MFKPEPIRPSLRIYKKVMGEMLDEEEFEGLNFKYSEECESLVGERYTFKAYTMKNGIDFISFFIKVGSEREVKVDFKEIIEI